MLNQDVVFVDRGRLYAWGALERQAMAEIRAWAATKTDTNPEIFANTLAMSECIVNTQIGHKWRLVSLGLLKAEMDAMRYKAVSDRLKQAKVPLLLMDLWPCWYGIETGMVLAAQLQDADLRLQHPEAQHVLAFLQQYTVVKNQHTEHRA